MNPVSSHERPPSRDLMINGLHPSPLKIRKESHFIQKSSGGEMFQAAGAAHPKQQGPVIIYTHSPKIIHTPARDFMALVQKLTGFSRSDEVNETAPSRPPKNKARDNSFSSLDGSTNIKLDADKHNDNDSSSSLTDENGSLGVAGGDVNNVSSPHVPTTISPTNPFFADIPYFTPNSTDFFFPPRPVYKFADNAIVSPSLADLNSPSLLEFMKGFPDY